MSVSPAPKKTDENESVEKQPAHQKQMSAPKFHSSVSMSQKLSSTLKHAKLSKKLHEDVHREDFLEGCLKGQRNLPDRRPRGDVPPSQVKERRDFLKGCLKGQRHLPCRRPCCDVPPSPEKIEVMTEDLCCSRISAETSKELYPGPQ